MRCEGWLTLKDRPLPLLSPSFCTFCLLHAEPALCKLGLARKGDLEKAEEPEIKLPNSVESEKAREFQKNIYFCFIDYAKAFDCVGHNKPEYLQETGITDYLTYLLRNLYAG